MNSKISAVIISAMVLMFSAAFVILPKSNFSENENRSLEDFPKFDGEDILSGTYMSDISSYLSDHFPMRDEFVKGKNKFEIDILNKKYVNNIFIGDDGYFIENYDKPINTDKIISNLNKFQDNIGIKSDFMLIPTQISIYEDKLPEFAEPLSQLKTIDKYNSLLNMNCYDIYDVLMANKSNEQLFYKSDHHWTTDGAYYAYVEYCNNKGFAPVSRNEYNVEEIEGFKGTVYSKLNYDNEYTKNGEKIRVYNKNFDLDVSYDGKKSKSLFNMDYADKKDKYSLFLNNINSFVEITNNSIKENRSLVLIKDSYANSMVPFLVNHYKKIYVFDPRSYKESISEFINNNVVDDVLLLYNVNTIDSDTGINAIY